MVLIRTNGSMQLKKKMTLEEMQSFVEGLIQIVPFDDETEIVVNDEGKLDNLPVNQIATQYWTDRYGYTDVIVGNAIIAMKGEIK